MRSVNGVRVKALRPTAAQLGAQVVHGDHQNIPPPRRSGRRLQAGFGVEATLVLLLLLQSSWLRPGGHRRSQERHASLLQREEFSRVCCLIRPIGGGGRGKNLVAAALRPLSTDGQPCDEHLTHQLLLEPLRKPMPRPIIHSHLTCTSRSMRPSLEQRANGRQGAGQQVRPPGTEHPPRDDLAAYEVKHLNLVRLYLVRAAG